MDAQFFSRVGQAFSCRTKGIERNLHAHGKRMHWLCPKGVKRCGVRTHQPLCAGRIKVKLNEQFARLPREKRIYF